MGDAPNGISTGSATPPIGQADVEALTRLADSMGFGRTHDMLRRVIAAMPYFTAPAQISGVSSEEIARAIYDASRERAGFHPISNERWGEFYDSGLQEALAIRAQADAVAELYGTSAQAAPVPSMRDFIRTGITGFKEHELREIVATFCKLPGIAPRSPDPAYAPMDPLKEPQYIIEGIILRRLHEKRIEGYTIETAKEIAEALSLSSTDREGAK